MAFRGLTGVFTGEAVLSSPRRVPPDANSLSTQIRQLKAQMPCKPKDPNDINDLNDTRKR
jgi:hypothetical protein